VNRGAGETPKGCADSGVAPEPLSSTGSVPASVPVPLRLRFPAIVKVPAAETVVAVTPVLTVAFPNARLVVGVILPLPENVELVPALSVRPPVAETVRLPPKLALDVSGGEKLVHFGGPIGARPPELGGGEWTRDDCC